MKRNSEGELEVDEREEEREQEEGQMTSSSGDASSEGQLVFVLEKASLEVGKIGKTYQLLNCDDHANFLRKHKRDPANYRPDIIHQSLLSLLDSPLNKSGKIHAIFVLTERNVLIQVNPHLRIPRTFKRFCGLMVQLLQKLSIRASNGPEKLLRVIKNPVTKYFPVGSRRIGLEYGSSKVVRVREFIKTVSSKIPLVFVVGAMAHGDINADYVDEVIAVSEYPLSAACCISRICGALELKLDVV